MGAKKKQLTLEQHQEIGKELAWIHDRLVQMQTVVANAHAVSSLGGRAAAQMIRTVKALDKTRSMLDASSSYEIPATQWSPRIYYPRTEDREADCTAVGPDGMVCERNHGHTEAAAFAEHAAYVDGVLHKW